MTSTTIYDIAFGISLTFWMAASINFEFCGGHFELELDLCLNR
jgi:hypothetical protein